MTQNTQHSLLNTHSRGNNREVNILHTYEKETKLPSKTIVMTYFHYEHAHFGPHILGFLYGGCTGDLIQGLMLVRQVLYNHLMFLY
jgi:hypothetical protein